MMELLLNLFSFFLCYLSICSVWLGYTNSLNMFSSVISIILSLFLSCVTIKKDIKSLIKKEYLSIALFSVYILLLVILILPNFIFPYTCSDIYNHARSTRIIAKSGTLSENNFFYPHGYPMIYYGVTAIFYILFQNTYVINSVFPIILLFFSVVSFYYLINELFNKKIALLASFFFAFSITNLWTLYMGFLTQLYGMFFLFFAFYKFYKKKYFHVILSCIGLIAYPHFYIIFGIFIVIKLLFDKFSIKTSILFFTIPLLLVFPESLGLLLWHISEIEGLALIRGGGMVPNIFTVLLLFPAVFGFNYLVKFKNYREFFAISLSIFLLMMVTPLTFLINTIIRTSPPSLSQFYVPIKLSYFLIAFISVLLASFTEHLLSLNKYRFFVYFFIILYMSYALGFIFILPRFENFPQEIYPIAEYLDNIPGSFTLGIDSCLMNNEWNIPWFYNSLIDIPDNMTTICPYFEAGRLFQFHWTNYIFNNTMYVPVYNNKSVIYYNSLNTDYILTCNDLGYDLLMNYSDIKLYKSS